MALLISHNELKHQERIACILANFPTIQAMFKSIKAGKYEYLSPFWDDVSDGARNVVDCLLVLDTKERYTAEQVGVRRRI